MPAATPHALSAVSAVLSSPRFATYLSRCGGDAHRAAELYGWNARAAAAFMLPAHFAEVAVRNAVDEALTSVYGERWPWSTTLEASLPHTPKGYSQRSDLQSARQRNRTTGKVVADLSFVFWPKMFTARHDERLWTPRILQLFPHTSVTAPAALRQKIYGDLEAVRHLRNRIAHHEPIFTRDLPRLLTQMLELVDMRSAATGAWVRALEDVSGVLSAAPVDPPA